MRALILAGVAALSLAAWGDPPPATNATPPAARPNAGKWVQKYDTNGDGVLSDQEKAAARGQRQGGGGGLMKRLDTNGDGVLSDAERQAGFAKLQQKNPQKFKQLDTNGDGQIDAAEAAAAMQKQK